MRNADINENYPLFEVRIETVPDQWETRWVEPIERRRLICATDPLDRFMDPTGVTYLRFYREKLSPTD